MPREKKARKGKSSNGANLGFVAKLRELEPIRHAIAHSRDVTKTQCDKLELYTKDIRVAVAAAQ